MANLIVGAIVLVIIGAAVFYIVKEKKKGVKCFGCPDGAACSGKCNGCNGSCQIGTTNDK